MFKVGDTIQVIDGTQTGYLSGNYWISPPAGYKAKIIQMADVRNEDGKGFYLQIEYKHSPKLIYRDDCLTWVHSSKVKIAPKFERKLPAWF